MKYDIFISYRRNNGFFMAQVIRDRLEAIGVRCFLDLDELRSGTYDDKLLSMVRQAPNFLIILTSGSLDRCCQPGDWVRKEVSEALSHGKTIIPVTYDGFDWDDPNLPELPDDIKELKRFQAIPGTRDYLSAMIDRILDYATGIECLGLRKKTESVELPPVRDTMSIGATVHTTVVDSILHGWKCSEILRKFGLTTESRSYQWSDKILRDLANGKIDMAIYNKQSTLRFNKTHGDSIHILRDVCSSMGGRNFYILASRKGKWTDMSLEQFKNSLDKDTLIGVSKSSDMFKNLLYILDMTEEELADKGVKVLDYNSAQGLSLFDVFPDILITAGQDIRYLARRKSDFFEIVNYEDFPEDKKDFFFQNSINSLMIGPAGLEKLDGVDLDELGVELMLSFYRNVMDESFREDLYRKLEWSLRSICDDEDDLAYIIRNIIFETYRIL